MTAKKHPLEIYKRHQGFFGSPEKNRTGGASVKKKSADTRKPGRIKAGLGSLAAAAKEASGRSSAPGERRISLSLNNVLIILIIIVTGFIGTYFLGYHKGQKTLEGLEGASLKGSKLLSDVPQGEKSLYPLVNEPVESSDRSGTLQAYGIQVATYLKKRESTARITNEWLKQRGFESRLFPVENESKFIIIVGSFSDKEDPELLKQLERVRSINDFPHGDAAPFQNAKILLYEEKKKS